MPQLLCIGYGYTASYISHILKAEGWDVHGTSRAGGKADDGTLLIQYQVGKPSQALMQAIGNASHILISVPPNLDGPRVFHDIEEIIRQHDGLRWLGYLSTTGVYGDHQGGWVDETTPLAPIEARSKIRVTEEQEWLGLHQAHTTPAHIFRIAGIYGPGRSAMDQVRQRRATRIDKPGQFFSRIHVEDLAGGIVQSMQRPMPGEIFNMSDDLPSPSHEPVTYACALLDTMPPMMVPFEKARLSLMARSFYKASRKVKNDKLKQVLGYSLKYPTYKEGLSAMHKQRRCA
jgi:nucleoside-diphosphate-sugar epimerase